MVEPSGGRTLKAEARREAMRVSRMGIGARLGRAFDDLVNEPVPAHWLTLLKMADARAESAARRELSVRRYG
jgi:hypothetical protein